MFNKRFVFSLFMVAVGVFTIRILGHAVDRDVSLCRQLEQRCEFP
jgi:hypothetical protein